MILAGLTGGVSMGKSTVAAMLERHGAAVLDTDVLARQLVEPGQPALADIVDAFGREVVDASGRLRRAELARIVFSDRGARARLEGILHPRIRLRWQVEVQQWMSRGVRIGVVVVPLLFEIGWAADFNVALCVACSAGSQRARMAARGWNAAECEQRIQAQWPIARKMDLADYVIWAEGSEDITEAQVSMVHARLLQRNELGEQSVR